MYFSASVPRSLPYSKPTFADGSVVREVPTGKYTCECGRRTDLNYRFGCEHCRWLDGQHRLDKHIIGMMRTIGRPMTITEIIDEMGVQPRVGKLLERASVQRAMTRMVAEGRARRYWVDVPAESTMFAEDWRHGNRQTGTTHLGAWCYSLCG